MHPPSVVVEFEVLEHVLLRLPPRCVVLAVHQFALERLERDAACIPWIAINAGGTGLRCARRAASHIDTEGNFLDNNAYEGFYESLKPKAVLR